MAWWTLHWGQQVKLQLTCHCACEAGTHLHSLHVLQETGKSAQATSYWMHRTVSWGLQQRPWQSLSPEVKLHPQRHRAMPAASAFQPDAELTTLGTCSIKEGLEMAAGCTCAQMSLVLQRHQPATPGGRLPPWCFLACI